MYALHLRCAAAVTVRHAHRRPARTGPRHAGVGRRGQAARAELCCARRDVGHAVAADGDVAKLSAWPWVCLAVPVNACARYAQSPLARLPGRAPGERNLSALPLRRPDGAAH